MVINYLKHILLLSVILANTLYVSPSVWAQETIKIGSMQNYAPYNFKGESGRYIGIDVAIVEAVLTKIGISFAHAPRPWKRALLEFERGTTQMLFQLKPSPERFEKWHMVGPIRPNNRGYFVRHDSDILDIKTIGDLEGLAVGIVGGYKFSDAFKNAKNFRKYEVTNVEQNVHKLNLGRVDVVIENVIPFQYQIRKLGFEGKMRMLPTFAETGERYVAFQKDEQGKNLAKIFQKTLDELIANAAIQSIIDTWRE